MLTILRPLFLALIFFILLFPFNVNAAELLQVKKSNLLMVGDQNRTYTIKLNCLKVEDSKEDNAIDFLRKSFPRRTKLNLQPQGIEDGILLANVFSIKDNVSFSQKIIDEGFGSKSC